MALERTLAPVEGVNCPHCGSENVLVMTGGWTLRTCGTCSWEWYPEDDPARAEPPPPTEEYLASRTSAHGMTTDLR